MSKELKHMNFQELRSVMIQRYDGNAGEIINGFQEMGLSGPRLLKAMVSYIERNPAYADQE